MTFSSKHLMVSLLIFHLCLFPIASFIDFVPPSFPLSCYHITLNLFKGCHFCRMCLREKVLFSSPFLVSLRFVFPWNSEKCTLKMMLYSLECIGHTSPTPCQSNPCHLPTPFLFLSDFWAGPLETSREKKNHGYSQPLLIDYFILVKQFSVPIMSLQMTEAI